MNIQQVSVDKLKAAAYNPRKQLKPGDAEYEKLKRSITEFGYVEPVIWNKTTGINDLFVATVFADGITN